MSAGKIVKKAECEYRFYPVMERNDAFVEF